MALSREPKLLLLDEPTAGMSPQERRATGELLGADPGALLAADRRARPGLHQGHLRHAHGARPGTGRGRAARLAQVQNSERVREVYLAMPDASLLEAEGLCTYYGTSQALFDVSLKAPSRGAVAILGRNGAGKTTLLQDARRRPQTRPRQRQVRRQRRHAHAGRAARAPRASGYVPQEQAVFARLTVKENLLVGSMARRTDSERIDEVVSPVPLPRAALRSSRPARSPAASARCSRSAARCSGARTC